MLYMANSTNVCLGRCPLKRLIPLLLYSTHIILYLPKFRNWMVPVAAENFGLCLFDV